MLDAKTARESAQQFLGVKPLPTTRPTIAELEKILNAEEVPRITLLPDGSIAAVDDDEVERVTTLILQIQADAIRECIGIVRGDNEPERVCCLGTRGAIIRKLDALLPKEPQG